MKNWHFVTLVAVAAFVLAGSGSGAPVALAQEASTAGSPRLITTTGEAEILVPPDEIVLSLGIETSNLDMATAKRQNDEIVTRLLGVARENGIKDEKVQTDYISIEPRYRDSYEKRDFIGFFVRKTVVITLNDIAKFEDMLSDSLQAGANYVHGIEFKTTELRKHRDRARALAIQAAKEKAVALAGELGQQVGQPHSIAEEQNSWWSSYGSWWGGRWGAAATQNVIQSAVSGSGPEGTLAPGQISVTARVQVTFELER